MQIKTHEEYNPSKYAGYAITSIKEDFKINLLYPNGFIEYTGYDLYDIGEQILICFYDMGIYKDNFTYYVVSDNKTEKISHQYYEWVVDVVNGDYQKDKTVFVLLNSVAKIVENYETLLNDPAFRNNFVGLQDRRCDLEEYGVIGFHDMIDGIEEPLLDASYFGSENILSFVSIINSVGNMHIVKLKCKDMPDSAYLNWLGCTGINRTLFGALKTTYQWAKCADDPWNNTGSLPVKCNQAMIDLDLSEEIISEIEDFSFPTVLERYLSNDPDPRRKIEEDEILPSNFKNWFISTLRYRTLGSLSSIHPLGASIPQSFVDKENDFFQLMMYKFCIENSLDVKTVDLAEISLMAHVKKYDGVNNSIGDIIRKSMLTNPKLTMDLYITPGVNN